MFVFSFPQILHTTTGSDDSDRRVGVAQSWHNKWRELSRKVNILIHGLSSHIRLWPRFLGLPGFDSPTRAEIWKKWIFCQVIVLVFRVPCHFSTVQLQSHCKFSSHSGAFCLRFGFFLATDPNTPVPKNLSRNTAYHTTWLTLWFSSWDHTCTREPWKTGLPYLNRVKTAYCRALLDYSCTCQSKHKCVHPIRAKIHDVKKFCWRISGLVGLTHHFLSQEQRMRLTSLFRSVEDYLGCAKLPEICSLFFFYRSSAIDLRQQLQIFLCMHFNRRMMSSAVAGCKSDEQRLELRRCWTGRGSLRSVSACDRE